MLQYEGFAVVQGGRQYSFSARPKEGPARTFTVFVSDARFRPGLLDYQGAPDVCYRRLKSVLAIEEEEKPVGTHHNLTESDIVEYKPAPRGREAHGFKKRAQV